MKVKIRKKGNQNTKELKNSLLEKEGKQDKITRDLYPKFTIYTPLNNVVIYNKIRRPHRAN